MNSSATTSCSAIFGSVKYVVPLLCGASVLLLIGYLAFVYTLPLDYKPDSVPSGNMDAHAITASAIQSNADLLTTIAIALSALFGFSVSIHLRDDTIWRYVSIVLITFFGILLTFVFVSAYAVYNAIAVQADHNVFYLYRIEPLINNETSYVMMCAVLSVSVFCWRCTKFVSDGGT